MASQNSKYYFFLTASVAVAAALISGCARQGVVVAAPQASVATLTQSLCTNSACTGTIVPAPTPTPTYTSTVYNGNPLVSTVIRGVGYTSVTSTVTTKTILKLTFTPGEQDTPTTTPSAGTTGFYANYSQLGVYITVGSSTQPTPMLPNGLNPSQAAQSSPILDFSSQIPSNCASQSAGCSITITVAQPNYDYWCYNYGMYCPWAHVDTYTPWNGKLSIQTDFTVPLTSNN